MNQGNKYQFTIAQLGARMHYAVPKILHEGSMLQHFYTDICSVKGWLKLLHWIPKQLQSSSLNRLLGRVPEGVPSELITAFTEFGFEYARRLQKARSASEKTQTFLWGGKTFNSLILQQGLLGEGVYTFNTAGLEILQSAQKQGLRTVMEQTIAPVSTTRQLLLEEHSLHPNWEEPPEKNEYFSEYRDREAQEWESADLIIGGSEFVKNSLIECGVPNHKCVVVPYGISLNFQPVPKREIPQPLRVLTVGTVGLRKGTPYVLEAAKRLKHQAVFRVIGPYDGVTSEVIAKLKDNLELLGQIPRSQIKQHYDWADVFLLPSICEGSAVSTYEALASGLPVIATPNTGSIVEDEISGFIVPIRDHEMIVKRLNQLISDSTLLKNMSQNAVKQAKYGSLSHYSQRLLQALEFN